MNIRPLLLGLPLLLTGCSTMSNFSWSSLSPLNWFGSSLEVSAKGVGDLNAGTPMSESAINDGLERRLPPARRHGHQPGPDSFLLSGDGRQ